MRMLDFTAPMPDGGWSGSSRATKEERGLEVGVRAIEKEQGKRDNPGGPEARAERGNTYSMQGRYQRAQVHFWPIAIEVDGHCSASFLRCFKNVCNASKDLTEQNPQAFKQYWWKRIACELHKMNAKLALKRAASARRSLLRLPSSAPEEMQYEELQTDLPTEVADRSSYRDRQRQARSAWSARRSQADARRKARPPNWPPAN